MTTYFFRPSEGVRLPLCILRPPCPQPNRISEPGPTFSEAHSALKSAHGRRHSTVLPSCFHSTRRRKGDIRSRHELEDSLTFENFVDRTATITHAVPTLSRREASRQVYSVTYDASRASPATTSKLVSSTSTYMVVTLLQRYIFSGFVATPVFSLLPKTTSASGQNR